VTQAVTLFVARARRIIIFLGWQINGDSPAAVSMNAAPKVVFIGVLACCAMGALTVAPPARAIDINDVQPCEPIDPSLTAFNYNNNYNDPSAQMRLRTVEVNHFDEDVQLLKKGETAPLPHDLDFALRAFPNFYPALNLMATWQLRHPGPIGPHSRYWTADCYFLRALSLWPNDWKLHYIYAIYLDKAKRLAEAQKQYDLAAADGASGGDYYYNRGLFEIDVGHLNEAAKYANLARAAGDPLPGLMIRLEQARRDAAKSRGKSLRVKGKPLSAADKP
jgi:Tfp pilus assembly protein PilF